MTGTSTEQPRGAGPGTDGAAPVSPMAVLLLGVTIFSLGPVMVAATDVSGPVLSFWRLWFGSAVLLVVTIPYVRRHGLPTMTGWRWAGLCGLGFGLHQLLFMTAIKETSVVDVTLMNTLAPVVVAVLAVPMFGERPGLAFRVWSGIAILGAGAVALLGSAGPEGNPFGMLVAAGNVVFYSFYFVWSKRSRDEIDTLPWLFVTSVVAALVLTLFVGLGHDSVGAISSDDLVMAFLIALLPGIVGHFSVTWSLRWIPANVPPVLMLTIPVLSGTMAWIFLGQEVTVGVALAGVLTIGGVAAAVRSSRTLMVREALDLAEEA